MANVINEAALLAVRGGRKEVQMIDLNEAVEKSIAGLQKKSRVIKEEERRIVAYHETGHALTAACRSRPAGCAMGMTTSASRRRSARM